MKNRLSTLFSVAFVLIVSLPALAQGGDIVSAQYGIRGRRVDVSDRVRSMARDGRLQFQVTNENLGGDPAPNRVKELVLRVRGWGGVREYHFAEKSYVDLDLGRGGRGPGGGDRGGYGNYGGSLQILRASYGIQGHYIDVTDLLQRHVNGDQLSMHINNDTMGADPMPHVRKELRVQYRYNGDRRDIVIPESGDLRIP